MCGVGNMNSWSSGAAAAHGGIRTSSRIPANQGSTKSLVALALLSDKLKTHGQMLTKIMYILSRLCTETVGKGL